MNFFYRFDKFEEFEGFVGLRVGEVEGFDNLNGFHKLDVFNRLKF